MKHVLVAAILLVVARPAFAQTLTQEQASAFAKLALKGVQREYPNKPGTVLNSKDDIKGPRGDFPICPRNKRSARSSANI